MNEFKTPLSFEHKGRLGFVYFFECLNKFGVVKWRERIENLIPTAGINYIVGASMAGTPAPLSSWYIGLSEDSITPIAAETMATLIGQMTTVNECVKYSGTTRKALAAGAVAAGLYSNAASPAEFTFTAAATIKLGFVGSGSAWHETVSTLISAVEFPSPRAVEIGDTLRVVAGIQLVAA